MACFVYQTLYHSLTCPERLSRAKLGEIRAGRVLYQRNKFIRIGQGRRRKGMSIKESFINNLDKHEWKGNTMFRHLGIAFSTQTAAIRRIGWNNDVEEWVALGRKRKISLRVVPAPNYEQIEMTCGIVRIWWSKAVRPSNHFNRHRRGWSEIEREKARERPDWLVAIVRSESSHRDYEGFVKWCVCYGWRWRKTNKLKYSWVHKINYNRDFLWHQTGQRMDGHSL